MPAARRAWSAAAARRCRPRRARGRARRRTRKARGHEPLPSAILPALVQVQADRHVCGAGLAGGERVHQDVQRLECMGGEARGRFLVRPVGHVDRDHQVRAQVARRIDRHRLDQRSVHQALAAYRDRHEQHRHGAGGAHGERPVAAREQSALAVGELGRDGAEAPRPGFDRAPAEGGLEWRAHGLVAVEALPGARDLGQVEVLAPGKRVDRRGGKAARPERAHERPDAGAGNDVHGQPARLELL